MWPLALTLALLPSPADLLNRYAEAAALVQRLAHDRTEAQPAKRFAAGLARLDARLAGLPGQEVADFRAWLANPTPLPETPGQARTAARLVAAEARRRVGLPPAVTLGDFLAEAAAVDGWSGYDESQVRKSQVTSFGSDGLRLGTCGLGTSIGIRRFTAATPAEVAAALPRTGGVVLDLRGCPGGSLAAAVEVAGLFLPAGAVVCRTDGPSPEFAGRPLVAAGGPAFAGPVAVRMDGGTLSAAEVLACALRSHRRAELVGTRTGGKGRVQATVPLAAGGRLTLTVAAVVGPAGEVWDGVGLVPDADDRIRYLPP